MTVLLAIAIVAIVCIFVLLSVVKAIRIEEGRAPYSPFEWENDNYRYRKLHNKKKD